MTFAPVRGSGDLAQILVAARSIHTNGFDDRQLGGSDDRKIRTLWEYCGDQHTLLRTLQIGL